MLINPTSTKGLRFRFSKGVYELKGTVTIPLNISTLVFYVVKTKIPFFIYFNNLNSYNLYYNNLTNRLIQRKSSKS